MAWNEMLQCEWKSVRLVGDDTVQINLPPGNCADMTGAIEFATLVLPSVALIRTYSDSIRDAEYRKIGGTWVPRLPRSAV